MASALTAADRGLQPLGITERRPLDLSLLRADLAALWRDEGHGVSRACHATLVISVSRAESVEDLLADLVRTRPSRVLLLETGATLPEGEIEAWATGSCWRDPAEGSLICSETIRLTAGPGADARVASTVRSLTVGGLPLEAMVLDGSPEARGWIRSLGSEIDRVIFLSTGLEARETAVLWARCLERLERPRYSDVAWAQTEGWRGVVASAFDADPAPLAALRRIEIGIEGTRNGISSGLLVAGWLGSRLGWKSPARQADGRWSLGKPDGSRGTIEILWTESEPSGGGLRDLRLEFDGEIPPRAWRWSPQERAWTETLGSSAPPSRVLRARAQSLCAPFLQTLRPPRPGSAVFGATALARALVLAPGKVR